MGNEVRCGECSWDGMEKEGMVGKLTHFVL